VFDPIVQFGFLASVALGIAIRFFTHKTTAPPTKILCAFQIGSFLMSMIWIYVLCEVIVDLLELFGIITGLPSSLLGITILSWGNSLGDTIASVSITKRGFGEMALTGCMAGPVFNLMLGLGITTLVCNLQIEGGLKFDIHNAENLSSLASLIATLISLLALIWIAVISDFKINQKHARIMLAIYGVSIVIISYVTLS